MPSFRARRNQSALGGAAMGAATGAMMGGPVGALVGGGAGLLSGYFGMKKTPDIPEINAKDMAADIARRDPTIMQMLSQGRGAISSSTEQYRQQLIASGMDASSASRIASEKGQASTVELGDRGVQAGERLKADLYKQLLPVQLNREEDILSVKQMYENQENAGISMLPMLASAAIAKYGTGNDTEELETEKLLEPSISGYGDIDTAEMNAALKRATPDGVPFWNDPREASPVDGTEGTGGVSMATPAYMDSTAYTDLVKSEGGAGSPINLPGDTEGKWLRLSGGGSFGPLQISASAIKEWATRNNMNSTEVLNEVKSGSPAGQDYYSRMSKPLLEKTQGHVEELIRRSGESWGANSPEYSVLNSWKWNAATSGMTRNGKHFKMLPSAPKIAVTIGTLRKAYPNESREEIRTRVSNLGRMAFGDSRVDTLASEVNGVDTWPTRLSEALARAYKNR